MMGSTHYKRLAVKFYSSRLSKKARILVPWSRFQSHGLLMRLRVVGDYPNSRRAQIFAQGMRNQYDFRPYSELGYETEGEVRIKRVGYALVEGNKH